MQQKESLTGEDQNEATRIRTRLMMMRTRPGVCSRETSASCDDVSEVPNGTVRLTTIFKMADFDLKQSTNTRLTFDITDEIMIETYKMLHGIYVDMVFMFYIAYISRFCYKRKYMEI